MVPQEQADDAHGSSGENEDHQIDDSVIEDEIDETELPMDVLTFQTSTNETLTVVNGSYIGKHYKVKSDGGDRSKNTQQSKTGIGILEIVVIFYTL